MTGATHIMAGLIIGQLTGDYPTAIACSFLVDADHLIPIIKQGVIFNPKKIWKGLIEAEDTLILDQRNYFHSIFALIVFSAIAFLINTHVGIVFAIAYAAHLLIDLIDGSNFYPFFPFKFLNIKGFIRYCSRQEIFFASALFIVWVVLVVNNVRI